ncbi:MAG TPA: glycosyltransferase [Patescibacteria group bacterium]|nr:glycosyltransferase [Patescibacteria group bacterium]
MRIGLFTEGFFPQPNGVSVSVFETAKELEKRGHNVIVVAPKYPGFVDKELDVIRLASVKVQEEANIRVALALPDTSFRRVLATDFDLIHAHSGGPITLLGSQIAKSKDIPIVITYHTLWNRYTHYFLKGKVVTPKMMERATKIFGNTFDYLIAPSERVEKELKKYGVRRPIAVVPSGIDTEKFNKAEKGFLRKITGIKDAPIVLFVGRVGREKNVDFLIRSFREVAKRSDAHLVIVGEGRDRKKLEALVKKLDLEKRVHFTGLINNSEIQKVYKDATVFVFASTTETQGLIIPEALASGVPVVVVDDPAYNCVEDGKNGFVVKKNINEFALKTLAVIENKELRKKLSEQAIITAESLSVKKTVDKLESVYFGLLNKYNEESVARIMGQNEKSERIFVVDLVFFATVIVLRFAALLGDHATYPALFFQNQIIYHTAIGLFLILMFLAALFRKRDVGLIPLVMLGVGLGLIIDEAWSIVGIHATYQNYWNPLNLLAILLVGVVPPLLIRNKISDRPKFYISTREQRHVNPENPKVSVVIPAYNEGNFIAPTLKSLLNQTYKNFELIVVDNSSTDNTSDVAASFGARVIKQHVTGVAATRQAGFFESKGEIVVSTDADSIVPENWIERIVEKYNKNKKLSAYGGLNYLYSGPVTARAAGRYLFPIFWRIDRIVNHGWNLVGFNMSARKDAFIKVGGFNSDLKMGEDIDLSQKLRTVGDIEIDDSLLVYSSGRRYKDGLFAGLTAYVPFWISKILLKKDKPFEFKAVRSEKSNKKGFAYLPLCVVSLLLVAMFLLANPALF